MLFFLVVTVPSESMHLAGERTFLFGSHFFYVLLVFELRKGVIILFFLNLNVIHGIENVIIFADMKLQAVLEMGTVVSLFFR